nr:hypothetical protein [Tanacetum cinerariifolium]
MSTQQDIYADGSESHPPMLNKENYMPWSSRLLWYAKSRPNGKLIYNSIINGSYVRRIIPELAMKLLRNVGNKMHKAFPLLVRKFPLPEGTSHCLKKNATARRKVLPLPEVCTAIIVKEKPSTKIQFCSIFVVSHIITLQRLLSVLIILEDPDLSFQQVQDMDQQYPTVAKIPMLDTGKFEQWQFRMQQYLQHEHYALWEVIEFRDSYKAPENNPSTMTTSTTTTSTTSGDKSERTVTLRTEDMQRKKNDFMGVEVEQDDLNQKFLTSLAPEWLMHTIVWINRSDLNTMSLDDLYNHLKVYEAEVQKKSEPNTQNIAFISSTKHSRGNDEVNTASVYTASSNVPTASANVATVSISQETTRAYIASQSGGSQIKFEDINQINEDDIEKMDIKWNMALLSMRADKYWKKTGKKIGIQGSDVAGFNKSKVECFNYHKMGHFVRECRAPRNQDRGRRDTYSHGSKAEEQTPKALMVFDNSLCSKDCKKNNDSLNSKITDLTDEIFDANNMIYHYKLALAQAESRLVEYKERAVKYIEKIRTFEFYDEGKVEYIETLKKELETLKQEKEVKDLSWTGLPECADDTVTDYSRPSPTVESSLEEDQNRNPSAFENVASPITPKQFVKFVKASDSQSKSKIDEKETPKKPPVKNAKQYRKPNKKPNVRGNQRNWNNLKSH